MSNSKMPHLPHTAYRSWSRKGVGEGPYFCCAPFVVHLEHANLWGGVEKRWGVEERMEERERECAHVCGQARQGEKWEKCEWERVRRTE